MPTFTALALDRLIEPGVTTPMAAARNSSGPKLESRNSLPNGRFDRVTSVPTAKLEKRISIPSSRSDGRNGISTMTADRKHHWPQISPALYATPEPTPLPDSPSSYPPSPYIINHKRRGPRLSKSFSQDDVAIRSQALNEERLDENTKDSDIEVATASKVCFPTPTVIESLQVDEFRPTILGPVKEDGVNYKSNGELASSDVAHNAAGENSSQKSVIFNLQQDNEVGDVYDPHESMSMKSNTKSEKNCGLERSLNVTTPIAEFYDAWEELSPESGPQHLMPDIEAELHETRLGMMVEIEKRKQAEDSLNSMRAHWQKIREQLSTVGVTLPADPVTTYEDKQLNDPSEQLSQQIFLIRFVSNSVGRGIAKAEAEMEMEAQLELKNFEIARLVDRLRYYEAVNREMSQRNQKSIEMARRLRQTRKRRIRWFWGSVAGALSLGVTVLAWSYFPTGKGSSSPSPSHADNGNCASKK